MSVPAIRAVAPGLVLAFGVAGSALAQTASQVQQVIVNGAVVVRQYAPRPRLGHVELDVPERQVDVADTEARRRTIILRQIRVENATLFPEERLATLWRDRLGRTITIAEISDLAAAIEAVYLQAGVFVVAAVPEQDFADGIVRIRVYEESFIETVDFRSDVANLESRLHPYIDRLLQMRPLRLAEIERILLLMSDLGGLSVQAALERPVVPGRGGTLVIEAGFTRSGGGVNFDNRGSAQTGPLQLAGRVFANDVFQRFETSTLTGLAIPNTPTELLLAQFAQDVPIGTHGLRFSYVLSALYSEPGGDLEPLSLELRSATATVGFSYPFLRRMSNSVFGRVLFNVNQKDLDALGRAVSRDEYRWLQFGLSATHESERFSASVSGDLLQGLDALGATLRGSRLATNRLAAPDFTALQARGQLAYRVADRITLTGQAFGQYGATPLPAATAFAYGGVPFGRAFDPAVLSGDSGLALSAEINVAEVFSTPFTGAIGASAFLDYGVAWTRGSRSAGPQDLASVGVGLTAELPSNFAATLSLAVPIKDVPDIADPGARIFFAISRPF